MELYAALARALSQHGVLVMFGAGGEVGRHFAAGGGRSVMAANEAGAMAMGFGYSTVTGKTGVVTVASRPALTGTLTGLIEGVRGRVPMLVIVEDDSHAVAEYDSNLPALEQRRPDHRGPDGTARTRPAANPPPGSRYVPGAPSEDMAPAADTASPRDVGPTAEMVLPTGAGVVYARAAETVLGDLAVALGRARTERRPVVFAVSAEVARRDVEYRDVALGLPQAQPIEVEPPPAPTPSAAPGSPVAVWLAASQIADAQRPVLLAGRGAIDARPALLRLAERIGAPLATTLKAKDLFRGEPFDLEIAGGLAGPVSRMVFDVADLVVCVGAGFDGDGIRRGAMLDGRRLVLIDADDDVTPQADGDVTPQGDDDVTPQGDVAVRGDPTAVADAVIDTLDALNVPSSGFRTPAMAARLAEQARMGDRPRTAAGTVDLETALRRLDDLVPQRRVVVDDGGRFLTETLRHVHPGDPRAYVLPVNFGSTGLGMGAAVGAAIGRPDVPVVMVCADDGFLRGGPAEFTTAARDGLDIIVIVANAGALRLARVADALGGEGLTVRGPADLEHAAAVIEHRSRPLLIDLRLDVPD